MMDVYIFDSFLGHLRCVNDKSFIRSTKNKSQLYITLFTKYLILYNN